MFVKREIIGSIVTLVFYFGILSALFSFATGMLAEDIKHSSMGHDTKTVSFAVSDDYLHEHNN